MQMSPYRIAAIQLNANANIPDNMSILDSLLRQAKQLGAHVAVTPELCWYRPSSLRGFSGELLTGKSVQSIQSLAKELKMAIVVGSFAETAPNEKLYNTSVFVSSDGSLGTVYRKIHLFDVNVGAINIQESRVFDEGDALSIFDSEGIRFGLSICFDLRFPLLYQAYMMQNVDVMTVPASFTRKTGEAHWETLLRSRAIETQSYMIAANQYGPGANGVDTYGHSMIIDPWGKILAKASEPEDSVVVADIDPAYIQQVRESIPCQKKWLKGVSS